MRKIIIFLLMLNLFVALIPKKIAAATVENSSRQQRHKRLETLSFQKQPIRNNNADNNFHEKQILPPGSTVQNLYSLFKSFRAHHCLLLIDNWQNVDISQTAAMPSIVRNFEQVFGRRKITSSKVYFGKVLIPKIYSLTRNLTDSSLTLHEYRKCPISKFYHSWVEYQTRDLLCVDVIPEIFLSQTRPWQCEIQVSLFMPDALLKNHVFPGFLHYKTMKRFLFLPSFRPKAHFLLSLTKASDLDSDDLLIWLSRRECLKNYCFYKSNKSPYSSQNHIHFVGQLNCDFSKSSFTSERASCFVVALHTFIFCVNCSSFIYSTPLDSLSFKYFESVDRIKANSLWYGDFKCAFDPENLNPCEPMKKFLRTELNAAMKPLKHFHRMKTMYSDDFQILSFALTSVLISMLGNVTIAPTTLYDNKQLSSHFDSLNRYVAVRLSVVDSYNEAIVFENKFAYLRFVSCGSRGLESLNIEQFVSVFEKNVWKCMLAVAISLLFAMNLMTGCMWSLNLSNKITCLTKVVLEQGDPFPQRYVKLKPFRCLIAGTLLGSLVLSNAFKSTNVYNIVLPKQALVFTTIHELVLHKYNVYSRIGAVKDKLYKNISLAVREANYEYFYNGFMYATASISTSDKTQIWRGISDTRNFDLKVNSRLKNRDRELMRDLMNNTSIHSNITNLIVEKLNALIPLVKIGFMTLTLALNSVRSLDFYEMQTEFIASDLRKCNKTAWVLPDYQAQKLTRNLHRSGKHSDVGIDSYFNPVLEIYFEGAVPLPLLLRASLIFNSGLLDWWSNLINRTDLVKNKAKEPPVTPSISGNIQIVFIFVLVGCSIAHVFMIVELHEYIFRIPKALYCQFLFVSCWILQKIRKVRHRYAAK